MNGFGDLSESVNRAIFLAVVLYFALVAYGSVANDPDATLAAKFVFGVIAVAVGVVLYVQSEGAPSVVLGAAVCLVAGGVLQFVFLVSSSPLLDNASSLAVFAGVGLYIYAVVTE